MNLLNMKEWTTAFVVATATASGSDGVWNGRRAFLSSDLSSYGQQQRRRHQQQHINRHHTTSGNKNSVVDESKDNRRLPLFPLPVPSLSVPVPVWSLATPAESITTTNHRDVADKKALLLSTSMNIVTFATAVSVAPPKQWIVSLYHGTRTKDFFCSPNGRRQEGVLQLLTPQHQSIVPILGKHSGYEPGYSKSQECARLDMAWIDVSWDTTVHNNNHQKNGPSSSTFAASFWRRNNHQECNDEEEDGSSSPGPFKEFHLLPACAMYLHLRICDRSETSSSAAAATSTFMNAGDHVVVLCDLVGLGTWNATTESIDLVDPLSAPILVDPSNVLDTWSLRQAGIL